MATDDIMERLLNVVDEDAVDSAVDALQLLLDDSTIERDAPPKNVTEAAALVGLSPYTLRYYEQEGLVRPARTAAGPRQYSAFDLRRLVFLTRMRMSGMSMRDLKRYIALVEQGPSTEVQRRDIMLAQRDRIRRQLRELTLSLEATEYKLRTYGGHPEP
jgi:DNA-binding transcriptional MerR regulator